jgi:transcriptional regulator with XRE-family HTH domain
MVKKREINEKYIHQIISNNIKRLRNMQNISQLSLALNSGLTQNFINDIENCKKGISAKSIAKLSTALDVEPYQFFLPEDMPSSEIMVYVRDLNDSLQKVVNELTQQYFTKNNK